MIGKLSACVCMILLMAAKIWMMWLMFKQVKVAIIEMENSPGDIKEFIRAFLTFLGKAVIYCFVIAICHNLETTIYNMAITS